jgi:hypothetical protein
MSESSNASRLDELLKPHMQECNVLTDALKEVAQEDAKSRLAKAKEMIRKAMDLKQQMDEAERTFVAQKKKWDKELGKAVSRLQNMANNKPIDEGLEEKKDE